MPTLTDELGARQAKSNDYDSMYTMANGHMKKPQFKLEASR